MLGTAPGLLSLLSEGNEKIKDYGLKGLHDVIDTEWPQIADELPVIEKLVMDESFASRESAALLASKTYYQLGNLSKALEFALLAGSQFDYRSSEEFSACITSYAIKAYITEREPSQQHTTLVHDVLKHTIETKAYHEALSLAIETRFVDCVQETLGSAPELLSQAIPITLNTVSDSVYRQQLLRLYVDFVSNSTDLVQLCQLFHALREPEEVAHILQKLRTSTDSDNWLIAYQICFDLAEDATQEFRSLIINQLSTEMEDLKKILNRSMLLEQYMFFLFKNNQRDHSLLVALKETLDTSRLLVHTSVVLSYMLMFAGTADDNFYRKNSQWFGNTKKWAQFVTAAAIGVIHIGHLSSAVTVLKPFFKPNGQEYVLGGALYALGLIYANYTWNPDIVRTIMEKHNDNSKSVVVSHGVSLALGLISMGTQDPETYTTVRKIMAKEEPESGEAAGYAMGMIMLGRGECEEMNELLAHANATEHEKIMRGAAMGLAFMMYGREESCETLVATLLESRQPLLRQSAAWVTSLAYVGTANNVALQRLLHISVSDVNPDVRRAAVIGVGFVLSKRPKDVPVMLGLLAKSYNPHVRSGAALAIGIACAGTGMPEAVELIKPLLDDIEDFVKQHAMIAMAMVLQQQSDLECPYAIEFRKYLRKRITKKRSDLQVFGICTAYGILNASGRNVVVSCNSLHGENSVLATVGLALFSNYFYWHPLALMLPLAFHPTAMIGMNKDLAVVDWEVFSGASPAMFANPPSFEQEKEQVDLGAAAKLSIAPNAPANDPEPEPEQEAEPEFEDDFEFLKNPCRVTLNQLKYIQIGESDQYQPVTGRVSHGFIMLKETTDQ